MKELFDSLKCLWRHDWAVKRHNVATEEGSIPIVVGSCQRCGRTVVDAI